METWLSITLLCPRPPYGRRRRKAMLWPVLSVRLSRCLSRSLGCGMRASPILQMHSIGGSTICPRQRPSVDRRWHYFLILFWQFDPLQCHYVLCDGVLCASLRFYFLSQVAAAKCASLSVVVLNSICFRKIFGRNMYLPGQIKTV